MSEALWVWGLPLAAMTRAEAVARVAALIAERRPSFFITASTHYAMLTHQKARLREVNARAAFLVADGYPLVWASRLLGWPLPERVAGSDMIYDLSEQAAQMGHRVFLLGAPPGVADEAARRLVARYPGLAIAGAVCPPFRDLTAEEHQNLVAQVRESRPDLLFLAFGQPKGEFWLDENLEALGVPVCVQIGASLDFVAGRVRRAPRWVQRIGLEWAWRMLLEPARLAPRYAENAWFIARITWREIVPAVLGRGAPTAPRPPACGTAAEKVLR
jgi:N-acetylglucosaminyldiphosphoundecaprenol N-acetyl-beta-D-mannosaminyltransferase